MARTARGAGLAGAALAVAAAGWAGANRLAVRRFQQAPDPVAPDELRLPDDIVEHTVTVADGVAPGQQDAAMRTNLRCQEQRIRDRVSLY